MKPASRKIILRIVISLFVLYILQSIFLCLIARQKIEAKKNQAYFHGQTVANAIQLTLDNILESTEAVKYLYLQYGEDCFKDFNTFAANIIADKPEISSIYIAPKGVIQAAYPEEVYASTIGFEMLKDPEQGPKAQLAVDTKRITVAGPHALIEGGVGFIIRNPVFVDNEFKGFTIVVLDWTKFVEHILERINTADDSYKYGVWKDVKDETALTDEDGFILRNTGEPISNLVDIEFSVPNDTWHLNIEPTDGWYVLDDMTGSILLSICFTVVALIALVCVFYALERKKLLEKEKLQNHAKNLYMQKLTDALEEARKATAAKTVFLNNMSHDIRTPMNAILGYTRLIGTNTADQEKVKDYVFKIEKAGEYLLSIINNILAIARIESGKEQLDLGIVDLFAPENSFYPMFENEIKEKQLNLTAEVDIKHQYVFMDLAKEKEISINLLSNSIKYTPAGGTIKTKLVETPCGREGFATYTFTIEDDGIGMSKDFQEHVFDMFERERNTTESKVIGTGLGMSIVKKLVDLTGGTITLESELGKGTKITVITTHKVIEEADRINNQKKVASINNEVLKGKHILLAEDNEMNAEISSAILTELGVTVDVAQDGIICIDKLRKAEEGWYDLILMDIQMPHLNGYQTTEKIRSAGYDIPIIAMTANAFEEDKQNALKAGMNGHIAKPIEIKELVSALVHFLG